MRKRILPVIVFIVVILFFFSPLLIYGKLPIPSDTIIGLYHPFRDLYANDYPRGLPFKNFLITDPVRQQYPWRELSVRIFEKAELPLWNPYSLAGTPLLGNMQSAALYPLNIFLFILPFHIGWSFLVLLQPILGGVFFYMFIRNLNISKWASLLGAFAFTFSGFNIAWLEWNTIGHSALWLPLILLSIDKIFYHYYFKQVYSFEFKQVDLKLNVKKYVLWSTSFLFALISSFFAGHLQTFFYIFIFQLVYLSVRWFKYQKNVKLLIIFSLLLLTFILITIVQWFPTLQFIYYSARGIDLNWHNEGWFLPWQNLIQFVIPDFFGNPATLNYWGIWNYGEFVGYVGLFPLMMALYAIFFKYDKRTLFFGTVLFVCLLFSLPTFLARLPYLINMPFISSAQPTRLIFIVDFCLAVLASIGLDLYIKNKKNFYFIIIFIGGIFTIIYSLLFLYSNDQLRLLIDNAEVIKRNTYLPLTLFVVISLMTFSIRFFKRKSYVVCILLLITVFDLLRFAYKFTPFTNQVYLFPKTEALDFLKRNTGNYRIMSTNSSILPPNFSIKYSLQSLDGYDPLYLKRYGELISLAEGGIFQIDKPFNFNRIITPQKFESRIIDLLGVKYVLSLTDISSPKLKKVFQEGQTQIYENTVVYPRVFFVENFELVSGRNNVLKRLLDENIDLKKTVIIDNKFQDDLPKLPLKLSIGEAKITEYTENVIKVQTKNKDKGFLVLTDIYYPSWRAIMDDKIKLDIYRSDYVFRGVLIPEGEHEVKFYTTLFDI